MEIQPPQTPPQPACTSVSHSNIKVAETKVRVPEARPRRGPPRLSKLGSRSAKSLTLSDKSGPQSTYMLVAGTVCPWLGLWWAVPPLQHGPHSPIFPSHCSPQLLLVFPGKRVEILLKAFPPFYIAGIPARHPRTPPWRERKQSGRSRR